MCSRHFQKEDVLRDLQAELLNITRKKRLRPDAVPKLQLLPGETVPGVTPRIKRQEERERATLVKSILAESQRQVATEEPDKRLEDKSIQTEATNAKGEKTKSKACLAVAFTADSECQTYTSQSTISTETDADALQQENAALRDRIKVLQRKLSKAQRQKKGKQIFSANISKANAIKICFKHLAWTPQQIKRAVGGKRVQWKKEDIVLGLTIRALSKRTYELLRKSKLLPLPSLSTLLEHIREFKCLPGIQTEVLEGSYPN